MSGRVASLAVWLPLGALGAALAWAVLSLPAGGAGLAPVVHEHLGVSGVENPVTAVLLNFRSYDTLLEISVLALAMTAVWSVGTFQPLSADAPGLVLAHLVKIVVPFMVLLGGYLLWVGSQSPGGAFQAGLVFAAAVLLTMLAGTEPPRLLLGRTLRALMMLGLLVFLAVGAGQLLFGRHMLAYPEPWAKTLILVIEAAAAISIGVILPAAFRGGDLALTGDRP